MRIIEREIVGAFIFSADEKLLLGKSKSGGVYQDCWMVPGGGVDDGETFEEAVIREIQEETGIDISNEEMTPFEEPLTGKSEKTLRESGERVLVEMRFNDYKVSLRKKAHEITVVADDDWGEEFGWFTKWEVQGLKLTPPMQQDLMRIGWLELGGN